MAAINRDPCVTRYLNRPRDEREIVAFHDRVIDHWRRYGFGFYAVEVRRGPLAGELIGFVGIAYPKFLPELAHRPELGWRLAPRAWGQGFATEAAQAVRDHAFERLELDELISIVHPENARSRALAERLGMAIAESVENPILGRHVDVWRLGHPHRRTSPGDASEERQARRPRRPRGRP
jgi:RimJ/RimL family protein N-acetyltransferase